MSKEVSAKDITVADVIGNAARDIEARRKGGQTMTASYFVEYDGVRWVVTITPAVEIQNILDGRRSIQ